CARSVVTTESYFDFW
nr:immunoglobulin heavy chain junction region [Mus musculus]